MYGTKQTQVKPLNALDVATEATILAAPTTGKRWRLLGLEIQSTGAGVIAFQDSADTVDKFCIYLAANTPRFFTFGDDGIAFGTNKGITADGPATCVISGYMIVVEED